jgi:hypothetical protein
MRDMSTGLRCTLLLALSLGGWPSMRAPGPSSKTRANTDNLMKTNMTLTSKLLGGLAMVLSTFTAHAGNYIFFAQQPLVLVSDSRELSSFQLSKADDDGDRLEVDKRLAASIGTLWAYGAGGTARKVKARVLEGYLGCDRSLVVETEDKDYGGLLSSRRLSIREVEVAAKSLESLTARGRELLSIALQKKKLTPKLRSALLQSVTVTPVAVSARAEMTLVISSNVEVNEATATAFLIADPDGRGKYDITREDVQTGSASDSEGYAGMMEFVLHADVDGDGVEELLVRRAAYETFEVILLRRGGGWSEVASVGGGC